MLEVACVCVCKMMIFILVVQVVQVVLVVRVEHVVQVAQVVLIALVVRVVRVEHVVQVAQGDKTCHAMESKALRFFLKINRASTILHRINKLGY